MISFDHLDDDIVDTAREKMEQQFTDRSVTSPGEMLHIFALKMMMAEHGITDHSVGDVVELCKAYIDDLLRDRTLPQRGFEWHWARGFEDAHEGRGYWVSDANKPDFKVLFDHLVSQMEAAFDQQAPKIAAGLLKLMQTDPKHLFEQISSTHNGENPYSHIALLHHIPAKAFVDAWLAAPKENWREIYYAVENRYQGGKIDRELKPERTWAMNVYKCLEDRAKNAEGFMALRIERTIPNALRAIANEDEE